MCALKIFVCTTPCLLVTYADARQHSGNHLVVAAAMAEAATGSSFQVHALARRYN